MALTRTAIFTVFGVVCLMAITIGLAGMSASQMKASRGLNMMVEDKTPAQVAEYVKSMEGKWNVVAKMTNSPVPNNVVVDVIQSAESFDRPLPKSIDPTVMEDFITPFNFLQDMFLNSTNEFTCPEDPFVAEIKECYVDSPVGVMYDTKGNLYDTVGHNFKRMDQPAMPSTEALPLKEFDVLINPVQRFSNMYYHFLDEILSRVVLALPYLEKYPNAKILMWDEPFVRAYFEKLGISSDRIEVFDIYSRYYADVMVYPMPQPRITPCKGPLDMLRKALDIEVLPEEERDTIVYLSRKNEMNRRVGNEDEVVDSIKSSFPGEKIVVYESSTDVDYIINLFQKAKMVIGPHGAGFSHIIFTAPGTKVLEMVFLRDPPMMFWHISGALDLEYYMVPVPGAHWTSLDMEVPVEQVISTMYEALDMKDIVATIGGQDGCVAGEIYDDQTGKCEACPAGTFHALVIDPFCTPCAPGQVSSPGSTFCKTCPADTFVKDAETCASCPEGLVNWVPGGETITKCISIEEHEAMMKNIHDLMFETGFMKKLDPTVEERPVESKSERIMPTYLK